MIFEDILGPSKPKKERLDGLWKKFDEICDVGDLTDEEKDSLRKMIELFEEDPENLGMTEEELKAVREFLMEGLEDYLDEIKEEDK